MKPRKNACVTVLPVCSLFCKTGAFDNVAGEKDPALFQCEFNGKYYVNLAECKSIDVYYKGYALGYRNRVTTNAGNHIDVELATDF